MPISIPHISVCVCTFKRPRFLQRLLSILSNQNTDDLFDYSIIIVDNDAQQSAKSIVPIYQEKGKPAVNYFNEPVQNISCARNTAVRNAAGDFIAFIDDDEFPEKTWLLLLYRTLTSFKADGVFGPVIPHFETKPPAWIIPSKILERKRYSTGAVLHPRDLRAGNVLFARAILKNSPDPFDRRLGRTGGEDSTFFKRMMDEGRKFVWCDEAPAFETVPPERLQRLYFLKRALLRGITEVQPRQQREKRKHSTDAFGICKSLLATVIYTSALPLFLLLGQQHLFMRYLVKNCDHIGKLSALCGIKLIKERDF
jgi:succinoglycan biosynthesis protein ExoM